MNTSTSEYYNKGAWEFFIGGVYSSVEHAIDSLGKTLKPSYKKVMTEEYEHDNTMLLDEMGLTLNPSEEYRKFVESESPKETPLTDYISRVATGPLWDSLIGLQRDKEKNWDHESSYDDNLETYHKIMNDGYGWERIPPYAYRKMDDDNIEYF